MDQQAGRQVDFYSRPCGRGDALPFVKTAVFVNFYSRPCGRGDIMSISQSAVSNPISTHAPAGGATGQRRDAVVGKIDFYSRPCGRGDRSTAIIRSRCTYFYSRPCGRGDAQTAGVSAVSTYFYSRPCGRGDHKCRHYF